MSSIVRVVKNSNFTVMSNTHLRDKNLSLKSKGLLSMILSLPEDWNYTVQGLVCLVKEGATAVKSCLKELQEFGYLKIEKLYPDKTKSGKIEYEYIFFENPEPQDIEEQDIENQGIENQGIENQYLENHPLYKYTEEQNTDNQITLSLDKGSEAPEVVKIAGLEALEVDGKLRVVDKNGEVKGGNPYTEKAYMVWEEIMGFPLKRDKWNSQAGYNMVRAKDKGAEWLAQMLTVCKEAKSDAKADYRVKNISNLSGLQKNWEYVVDYARQKALKDSKKNVIKLF